MFNYFCCCCYWHRALSYAAQWRPLLSMQQIDLIKCSVLLVAGIEVERPPISQFSFVLKGPTFVPSIPFHHQTANELFYLLFSFSFPQKLCILKTVPLFHSFSGICTPICSDIIFRLRVSIVFLELVLDQPKTTLLVSHFYPLHFFSIVSAWSTRVGVSCFTSMILHFSS